MPYYTGYPVFDPEDPYSILSAPQEYSPNGGWPIKQYSDQMWDLIAPTSDSQTMSRVKYTAPNNEGFSQDAFWATDPILRGPLAQALRAAKGDSIGAYDVINSPEFRQDLLKQIGKTEWNQLRSAGILPQENLPGEELDNQALDYVMGGLENVLATGSPTMQRNAGLLDSLSERYGGRPYPGGEMPGFEGPGFGGVGAPEGAPGQGGPGNAAPGVPDQDMMQRLETVISGQPAMAEMPHNAYHAALQSRLRQRGYTTAGKGRDARDYRGFFQRVASQSDSRQSKRSAAKFFGKGVSNMRSRGTSSSTRRSSSSGSQRLQRDRIRARNQRPY